MTKKEKIINIVRDSSLNLIDFDKAADKILNLFDVSNCGGGIPYNSLSDSFKKSIDSIEDNLNR